MRLPKMLSYPVQNLLLSCLICYAMNPDTVVVAEKHPTPLHFATKSGPTRPPLRLRYHIRAGSSLVETVAFAYAICTCLDKLHGESEKSVKNR